MLDEIELTNGRIASISTPEVETEALILPTISFSIDILVFIDVVISENILAISGRTALITALELENDVPITPTKEHFLNNVG